MGRAGLSSFAKRSSTGEQRWTTCLQTAHVQAELGKMASKFGKSDPWRGQNFRLPFGHTMISAKVKAIYTITMDDLEQYVPEDFQQFCIFVRVMAGPLQSEGAEAFDVKVCNPKWLEQQ